MTQQRALHPKLGKKAVRYFHLFWAGCFAMSILPFHIPFASASTPESSTEPKTVNDAKWRAKMQNANHTLLMLLQDVYSDSRFYSRKNKSVIQKRIDELAKSAHELTSKGITPPDKDPTIPILADLFASETQRASEAFRFGNPTYARGIIKGVMNYCVGCHTRTSPQVEALKPPEQYIKGLDQLEKGHFFAATHRYEAAYDEFKDFIGTQFNKKALRPFDLNRAAHYALVIAVRIKNSPEMAMNIVDLILKSDQAPYFLKQDAIEWKKAIAHWTDNRVDSDEDAEDLYEIAQELLKKAKESQKFPADRSADIWYLRASAITHRMLKKGPEKELLSKGLLLAGTCYEVLGDLDFSDLHEIFYESCIRKSPFTETAQSCYQRYEYSVFLGFTGSSGTEVPMDIQNKLSELKELVHKQNKETKSGLF